MSFIAPGSIDSIRDFFEQNLRAQGYTIGEWTRATTPTRRREISWVTYGARIDHEEVSEVRLAQMLFDVPYEVPPEVHVFVVMSRNDQSES